MRLRIGLLADVTHAIDGWSRIDRRGLFFNQRRKHVRRGDRGPASRTDAGRVQDRFLLLNLVGSFSLTSFAIRFGVCGRKRRNHSMKTLPLFNRKTLEKLPVAGEPFQEVDGLRKRFVSRHYLQSIRKVAVK